jgi:hypothetical protein
MIRAQFFNWLMGDREIEKLCWQYCDIGDKCCALLWAEKCIGCIVRRW